VDVIFTYQGGNGDRAASEAKELLMGKKAEEVTVTVLKAGQQTEDFLQKGSLTV
jgi:hypothetical protein